MAMSKEKKKPVKKTNQHFKQTFRKDSMKFSFLDIVVLVQNGIPAILSYFFRPSTLRYYMKTFR